MIVCVSVPGHLRSGQAGGHWRTVDPCTVQPVPVCTVTLYRCSWYLPIIHKIKYIKYLAVKNCKWQYIPIFFLFSIIPAFFLVSRSL